MLNNEPKDTPMKTLWKCEECGSYDLQVTAWVSMNEGKVLDQEPPMDDIWCPECECETTAVSWALPHRQNDQEERG